MRNYFLHAVLLCLLVSFGCSSPLADLKTNIPVFDEAKESAAIYSAAIKYAAANGEHGFGSQLFISSNPISDTNVTWAAGYPKSFEVRFQNLIARYSSVDEEVLKSFLLRLQDPVKFDQGTKLTLERSYEFLDGDLVDAELEKPVLGGEPSKLPGPVLRLSGIGFNSSYDKAFFQMEYVACPLCGFGAHFSLEKIDGEWKIKESIEGWIS